MDKIIIKGAKEHNLKNIDLEIPKNKLVVITGLSGSGKSSLAFDTIYAEGQRRYLESLSTYARQFLGIMGKPEVEMIEGLSPAIALQQRVLSHNPRSIVGTITEIYDYFRVLFARAGIPYCPIDKIPISAQSLDEIVTDIMKLPLETKIILFSPIIRGKKGIFKETIHNVKKKGYVRLRIDNGIYGIDEAMELELDKNKKHSIDIVIDRIVMRDDVRSRLYDSCEISSKESNGLIGVEAVGAVFDNGRREKIYSQNFMCPICGWSLEELSPRVFSFNSPYGACEKCSGLGYIYSVSPDLIVNDKKIGLNNGLFDHLLGFRSRMFIDHIMKIGKKHGFNLDKPFEKYNSRDRAFLFYGNEEFEGVANIIERRMNQTTSQSARDWYLRFFTKVKCGECNGMRLKNKYLNVFVDSRNIWDLTSSSISFLVDYFRKLKFKGEREIIARPVIDMISSRLEFLLNVGLPYITLDRTIDSLSGGENERIKLATQLGTRLTGVIYILDEPTIGLHSRDTQKLLNSLLELRDLGNTIIVVEHDRDTIKSADHIVDLGPGSGIHGGYVTFSGNYTSLKKSNTLTGMYISDKMKCIVNKREVFKNDNYIKVYQAEEFNLKKIDVRIPLNRLVCITGVSGAGKSTLMYRILYQGLLWEKGLSREKPGKYTMFENIEKINEMKYISQHPIGRMSRSNIATYTKIFDVIRDLFSMLPESKMKGFNKGTFSFNVKGGRCEVCQGEGIKKIEMHFLPDVYVKCDICNGKKFNQETLTVKYKGKNIHEVLEMTVEEAYEFFKNIPNLKRKLQLLMNVGLSYIKLGQPATTLSGGEAQRIKLSRELSKKTKGNTLYFMDEPTTGLHFDDIKKLLNVIFELIDKGNSFIVIEHNTDFLQNAQHFIDLGPEGGDAGGYLIAEGTLQEITKNKRSSTGAVLPNR